MPKMKEKDVRAESVRIAIEALKDGTFMEKAEPAGQNCYAYPVELDIDGNGTPTEIWVTADFTCKMWRQYNAKGELHEPYNPFEVEAEWQDVLAERKRKADEAAEKKAQRVEKQKALKAKAEAKKTAKAKG